MWIQFECDLCGAGTDENRIDVTIPEHNGTAEIGWRLTPQREEPVDWVPSGFASRLFQP